MASLRTWFLSLVSLLIFFLVKLVFRGYALPLFVATLASLAFIWHYVLRIPSLKTLNPLIEEAQAAAAAALEAVPSLESLKPLIEETEAVAAAAPAAKQADAIRDPVHDAQSKRTAADASVVQDDASDDEPTAEPSSEAAASNSGVDSASDLRHPAGVSADLPKSDPRHPAGVSADLPKSEPRQPAGVSAHLPTPQQDIPAPCGPPETEQSSEAPGWPAAFTEAQPVASKGMEDRLRDGWSESSEEEEPAKADADFKDPEKARELKGEGNVYFKAGKLHDARECYSEALYLMPETEEKERAVLFCNRAAVNQKWERWDDVVNDCRDAIKLDPDYCKAYSRRSLAYEKQQKWSDANDDLKKAMEMDVELKGREYKRQKVLEARAAEQFEKDKDEMMGKLKDVGNMVLGKFGMSVDNFKMEQDPETGSYSIKYNNG